MNGEVTAQLVVSSQEAYVAYSVRRRRMGPNGEPRIARLLHTSNRGQTWSEIPWRRTLWSRISHLGFPTWPPEGSRRSSSSANDSQSRTEMNGCRLNLEENPCGAVYELDQRGKTG